MPHAARPLGFAAAALLLAAVAPPVRILAAAKAVAATVAPLEPAPSAPRRLPRRGKLKAKARESLEACLRAGVSNVTLPDDDGYETARRCRNTRQDIMPEPYAIALVANVQEVSAAVLCAAPEGVEVCARAGAHGFENDAGCSEGIVLDVQGLTSLAVDPDARVVHFGAGNTLGQLYYQLQTEHGLTVPGGSVSGVGAAGLFLGCGRGMLTQLYGLACDTIEGVEFVDAKGQVRIANNETNKDMYWMARGGGGEFPGIVTSFTVRAFDAPRNLRILECTFRPVQGRALLKAWLSQLEHMVDASRRVFSHITLWGDPKSITWHNLCFDCDDAQMDWLRAKVFAIRDAVGGGDCPAHPLSWLQQLLVESGLHQGAIDHRETSLMDRNQGWGAKGELSASVNGGHVLDTYNASEALLDTLLRFTFEEMPPGYPWGLAVMLYPIGGPTVEAVAPDETAYGARSGKVVLHYKFQWKENDAVAQDLLVGHHEKMTAALDDHLPCKGFYNYMPPRRPCARTPDEELALYFHDVQRMRGIRGAEDPGGVFRSKLQWRPARSEALVGQSRRRRRSLTSLSS